LPDLSNDTAPRLAADSIFALSLTGEPTKLAGSAHSEQAAVAVMRDTIASAERMLKSSCGHPFGGPTGVTRLRVR